jgi:hypothetical protein
MNDGIGSFLKPHIEVFKEIQDIINKINELKDEFIKKKDDLDKYYKNSKLPDTIGYDERYTAIEKKYNETRDEYYSKYYRLEEYFKLPIRNLMNYFCMALKASTKIEWEWCLKYFKNERIYKLIVIPVNYTKKNNPLYQKVNDIQTHQIALCGGPIESAEDILINSGIKAKEVYSFGTYPRENFEYFGYINLGANINLFDNETNDLVKEFKQNEFIYKATRDIVENLANFNNWTIGKVVADHYTYNSVENKEFLATNYNKYLEATKRLALMKKEKKYLRVF